MLAVLLAVLAVEVFALGSDRHRRHRQRGAALLAVAVAALVTPSAGPLHAQSGPADVAGPAGLPLGLIATAWERYEPAPLPTVSPPDLPALRPDAPRMTVRRLVVSPVDPKLAYAFATEGGSSSFLRTQDGGTTWVELHRASGTTCAPLAPVFMPDRWVRERFYYAHYCAGGRTFSTSLLVSNDAGVTLDVLAQPRAAAGPNNVPTFTYPRAVAFDATGRRGALALERDSRIGSGLLLATDDGGVTWRTILNFPVSRGQSVLSSMKAKPEVTVNALAVDFGPRTRYFVGLGMRSREVLASEDGGITWHSLGVPPDGSASDMQWDLAARALVVTTEKGTWRLAVGDTPLAQLAGTMGLETAPGGRRVAWETAPWVAVQAIEGSSRPGTPPPPVDRVAAPYWVAVEPDGAVLVAHWTDRSGNGVLRLSRIWPGTDRPAAVVPDVLPTDLSGLASHNPNATVWRGDGTTFVARPASGTVDAVAPDGSKTVVAGTGRPGPWRGEGLPATQSALEEPWGLALDAAGRLLIVDRSGHRVVRLEEDGTLRTVTGGGRMGYAGDGGPATAARLSFPVAATVDAWGRIYVADLLNGAVRVVDTHGTMWTLLGTRGLAAPEAQSDAAGDPGTLAQPMSIAWDGSGGVYVADFGNHRVVYASVPPAGELAAQR